jgi:hypothetical protein
MSKVTQLASGQITEAASITVELVEADETPAAVLVRWPSTARRTWAVLRLSAAGARVGGAGQGSDGSEGPLRLRAPPKFVTPW